MLGFLRFFFAPFDCAFFATGGFAVGGSAIFFGGGVMKLFGWWELFFEFEKWADYYDSFGAFVYCIGRTDCSPNIKCFLFEYYKYSRKRITLNLMDWNIFVLKEFHVKRHYIHTYECSLVCTKKNYNDFIISRI